VFLGALGFARSVLASDLGPTRPSDLVLLTTQTNSSACQGLPAFDTLIQSDGSFAPGSYSIPPGRVLVMTRFQWNNGGLPANHTYRAVLEYRKAAGDYNGFGDYFVTTDAQGNIGAQFDIGPIAVKSGAHLCAETTEPGFAPGILRVFGFLARDR
jgi:hypothetical protein